VARLKAALAPAGWSGATSQLGRFLEAAEAQFRSHLRDARPAGEVQGEGEALAEAPAGAGPLGQQELQRFASWYCARLGELAEQVGGGVRCLGAGGALPGLPGLACCPAAASHSCTRVVCGGGAAPWTHSGAAHLTHSLARPCR
jgi:hypothetical protein